MRRYKHQTAKKIRQILLLKFAHLNFQADPVLQCKRRIKDQFDIVYIFGIFLGNKRLFTTWI